MIILPEQERLIHGLKTGIACIIGYSFSLIANFQATQWLVVSIMVVMCAQMHVGSVLQKTYMRFIGTLVGSIIAAATLYFFPHEKHIYLIIITVCGIVFSYIATSESKFSETGTLGAVSATIILLSQQASITIAQQRFTEISLGLLIATLVSQFIFPSHARNQLIHLQAKAIMQFSQFYQMTIMKRKLPGIESYQALDEDIVKSLSTQRTLAKESKRELLGMKFSIVFFYKILRCEKEIFRIINFMRYAAEQLDQEIHHFFDEEKFKQFHDQVLYTFDIVHGVLELNHKTEYCLPPVDFGISPNIFLTIDDQHRLAIDAYFFAAKILNQQLNELLKLLKNRNTDGK